MKDISRIFLVLVLSALLAAFLSACGDSGGASTIIGGTPSVTPGELSGAVWNDLNQDQTISPGEPRLPDIEVNLYIDSNENGSFDLTDELISTTKTDSNGNYSFTVDSTDRYFVSIPLLGQPTISGWLLTTNTDEQGLAILRVDVTNLNAGIKDLNFGFVNPTKWGFDISPNGSALDIVSSPAVAPDGTIYIGSGNGSLYAILPTGTLKWKYDTGGAISGSPAIGNDGTVYIGSADRQFYAINPNGDLKWVYPTKSILQTSPAIGSDGTLYIVGKHADRYIYQCLDKSTRVEQLSDLYAVNPNGTLKWAVNWLSGEVHSSPAIAPDGTIYIGSTGDNDDLSFDRVDQCDNTSLIPPSDTCGVYSCKPVNGFLYAINPDGTMKWNFKTIGDVDSSPAIGTDGTVYVGSDYSKFAYGLDTSSFISEGSVATGFMYAINPNGTLKWLYDALGDVNSSPSIGSDETIYFGSDKNDFFALNPDGTLRWLYPTRDDIKSSPAIALDGTIYVGSNDGSLYALNPDGTLNMRYIKEKGSVNSSPSIGTDGTVYFATGGGTLYAIIRNSPLADTPWPKFRHDLKNTGRK